MPYTAPYLPASTSNSAPSTSTSSSSPTTTTTKPAPLTATLPTTTTKPPQAPAPALAPAPTASVTPKAERRRSTLTSRFPLLRKASREVTNTRTHPAAPAIHIRGSSASVHKTTGPDARLLASTSSNSTEPRASTSSSRGRLHRQSAEQLPSRDPSRAPSTQSARQHQSPDSVTLRSSTLLHPAPSARNSPVDHEPRPSPVPAVAKPPAKMHQTSSRLLRMTDDERPFTRDFKDLFSTLMVSLPLTAHRVRFRMVDFTFTSDEAITNLGSLKFSQSNRMPDPNDASRVVTTTTTTTFTMAKEMARSVCQRFLEAKFVESVENKLDFTNKTSVWQLSPKGIHILERFCSRNGIQSAHVRAVVESNRNPRQLVVLERNTETDKLHHDEQTIQIIFRRFVGENVNDTATGSDSESISEFSKCDIGVRMMKHRSTTARPYDHVFTGKATVDWLIDCSTMVDRREGLEIGGLFLELGLIAHVDPRNDRAGFLPLKQAQYYVTPHGEKIAGWRAPDEISPNVDGNAAKVRDGVTRDSNSNRTLVIIRNPSWRLLYREFLKDTMCEENLSFYLEVQDFNNQYKNAISNTTDHKNETIRETLAAAYGLYNAFLAPGSPNELNIDHSLRTQLATRMTRAVGDDVAMLQSLVEVASLFEKAQSSIFKLMSSDSVPKFIKHPKYAAQLRGLDAIAAGSFQPSAGAQL